MSVHIRISVSYTHLDVYKRQAVQQGGNTAPLLLPQDSDLREAAHSLNDIEQGISTAVEERVKSERMKVELITNVSHDIKTCLLYTSPHWPAPSCFPAPVGQSKPRQHSTQPLLQKQKAPNWTSAEAQLKVC